MTSFAGPARVASALLLFLTASTAIGDAGTRLLSDNRQPGSAAMWTWGPAEEGFASVYANARGYMARISDLLDMAGSPDPCFGISEVPRGRRELAKRAAFARQYGRTVRTDGHHLLVRGEAVMLKERVQRSDDVFLLRTMTELRAAMTPDELRQKSGKALSPDIHAIFGSPLSEGEVKAQLQSIHNRAAMIASAHVAERIRLANASYPDRRADGVSKIQQRATAALDDRMASALIRLCKPGLVYYYRGLIPIIDPLVPKLRARLASTRGNGVEPSRKPSKWSSDKDT